MSIISDTKALAALCEKLSAHEFLTIDTEFLRDKTYYPQLCLVQMAGPGIDAVAIDPLAKGIDLAPLYDLMANERILKVFHAARQDVEILFNLTGKIPHPIFDTQVAAMVCGYGEQVGYNAIVADVCKVQIDKGAQFTDWARRPLTPRQLAYALDDVTYLRDVYLHLSSKLARQGRTEWVNEEMEILTDPATYRNAPEDSWKRIKIKTNKPKILAVLREVSAWREREAQRRDIPRGRVLRDEMLAEIAIHPPKNVADLRQIRNMPGDVAQGKYGEQLLEAVKKGLSTPPDQCPKLEFRPRFPQELTPVLEMLKMLLRIQASEHHVAAKLIADSEDLEDLAVHGAQAQIHAVKGWRYDVFGQEAQRLLNGELAITLKDKKITLLRQ